MRILIVCALLSVTLVCGSSLSNSQSSQQGRTKKDTCCSDLTIKQTHKLLDSLAIEIDKLNKKTIEVLFATPKMAFAKNEMRKRYGRVNLNKVRKIHTFVLNDTTTVYVVELHNGVLISPVRLSLKDSLTFKNK